MLKTGIRASRRQDGISPAATITRRMHSTPTESNPGQKASDQDSGTEGYTHRLKWPLLDRVLRILDYVFGGIAAMLDGLPCRPHTIFRRVSQNGPNL